MRRAIFAAVIGSIATVAAMNSMAATAKPVDVPKRKPGLWEITTVAADTGMTTITACIDADDHIVTPADSGACSQPKAERAGDTTIVDVVCKRGHGKQTMSAAFTGDFESRYHAIMKISFDPPDGVRNMGVIIDGKYVGPDCTEAETRARTR